MPRMPSRRLALAASIVAVAPLLVHTQERPREQRADAITVLKPARVFDGREVHEGWAVRVKGERIDAAGPAAGIAAAGATVIDLPGTTLTPGLLERHPHILPHPSTHSPSPAPHSPHA